MPATPPTPITYTAACADCTATRASSTFAWLCSSYPSVMSTITCRRSLSGTSRDASIRPSEIAVPPLDEIACTAPAIVSRSPVGPVIGPSDFAKGATMMRSFGRRKSASRPAARPNELHPGVHALARVHEQRVGDRQRFDAGEVDRLRLVVLEHAERGGVEAADEPIGFVHHGRFEQDSRGARGLENFERSELDRIRRGVAERIGRVDADAGRLERVGVRPLDRIRRTFPVVANQRVVHVEPDRFERELRRMVDLRDDADGARQPEAAERRRDAHRQQRLLRLPGSVEGCRTRQRA